MASQTQGIQQLLAAEKRAAEKVSEARKRKNRRLKQAKEEAQAEIEKYKAEREKQFREHEQRYVGSKGDIAKRIEMDTKAKIDEMNNAVKVNKQKVMDNLNASVCEITPKVHQNFRGWTTCVFISCNLLLSLNLSLITIKNCFLRFHFWSFIQIVATYKDEIFN